VSELRVLEYELRLWEVVELSWLAGTWRVAVRRPGDLNWHVDFGQDLPQVLRRVADRLKQRGL
jgi:hypothetical protein